MTFQHQQVEQRLSGAVERAEDTNYKEKDRQRNHNLIVLSSRASRSVRNGFVFFFYRRAVHSFASLWFSFFRRHRGRRRFDKRFVSHFVCLPKQHLSSIDARNFAAHSFLLSLRCRLPRLSYENETEAQTNGKANGVIIIADEH